MSQIIVVVEAESDWAVYYPSDKVMLANDYLAGSHSFAEDKRTRVINLCRNYEYLGIGYYVSLMAQARGQRVLPSLTTINDLAQRGLVRAALGNLEPALNRLALEAFGDSDNPPDKMESLVCFGEPAHSQLSDVARAIFEQIPCPILKLSFRRRKHWVLESVRAATLTELTDAEQDAFAETLDKFSAKVWRKSGKKHYRYDLAILVEPGEQMPPSNKAALKRMVTVGHKLGLDVELITRRDYIRLAEFDALFIRTTTALNHYTYRFARKAEREGLVVIDDPTSILRCTNKVYLSEALGKAQIPTPETHLLLKGNQATIDRTLEKANFPLVLKIPDGAFSRGMSKVETPDDLPEALVPFFAQSNIVLAQSFCYTDYDWRIGVFDGEPLFACRYYMSRGHWQIYHHKADGKVSSGDWDTLPVSQVPGKVLKAALKAASLMGNGLYGVDLKQSGDQVLVIEVNDNPNLDAGIEDEILGDELYRKVFSGIIERIEDLRGN